MYIHHSEISLGKLINIMAMLRLHICAEVFYTHHQYQFYLIAQVFVILHARMVGDVLLLMCASALVNGKENTVRMV